MSRSWAWWRKYILNIDTIIAIIVVCTVLYFAFTSKRKRYKLNIPLDFGLTTHKNRLRGKGRTRRRRKLNKHEEECRKIFQHKFGVRFKSIRPKWLKNPVTKKNLELDGYNPDIITPIGKGLAFEYDGRQHSEYVPHFHPNGPIDFEYQVTKDSWKDKKCKELGIVLIRIPHFVVFHDLDKYITRRLGVKHVTPGIFRQKRLSPGEVYKSFASGSGLYG